jgi:hypothetical protein
MSVAGIGGPGGWDEIRGLLIWIRIGVLILIVGGLFAWSQLGGLPDRVAERVPSDFSGTNADAQIDAVNQKLDRICAFLGMQSAAPADDPCGITSP